MSNYLRPYLCRTKQALIAHFNSYLKNRCFPAQWIKLQQTFIGR